MSERHSKPFVPKGKAETAHHKAAARAHAEAERRRAAGPSAKKTKPGKPPKRTRKEITITHALDLAIGKRINPPARSADKARYDAVAERWIREWLARHFPKATAKRTFMSVVANWILERVRPYSNSRTPSENYPKERERYLRERAGVHWIAFGVGRCAKDTRSPPQHIRIAFDTLCKTSLVECVRETKKPADRSKAWYGPNTRLVRVRYELFADPDGDDDGDDGGKKTPPYAADDEEE